MTVLPEVVSKAWDEREVPVIFSTVDGNGSPNAIYATCVSKFNEETLLVADNYFSKTKHNILNGSNGSILFMTKDRKAYQVKGSITYHTQGELFDDMKRWNPTRLPGHAVAALIVEEVYQGADKLL